MTLVNRSPGGGVRPPVVERDRLPRLVPREVARRHRRTFGADIRAEREQVIEPLKKRDVPRLGLGDGELRERRIRVDEDFVRDSRVLVAPEPRAAGKIDEQVGVRRVAADVVGAAAVIAAVVVHERPAIAKPERRERGVDVGSPVARIGGARVLHRVVHALAGVLDVKDLVSERPKAEEIHQRTPGDAAERVARDDAREEDSHGAGDGPGPGGSVPRSSASAPPAISSSTVSGSSSDLPTDSRAHIRR